MIYALVLLLLIVCFVVNDILLELKIKKFEKEIIAKDNLVAAFKALDKAINKLNDGFKGHERRLDIIEEFLIEKYNLKEEKESEGFITCEDCEFYDPSLNLDKRFLCKRFGHIFPDDEGRKVSCSEFEKKEDLDEDEYVVYADNVKVDISSKAPHVVYKTDKILTYEEYVDRISRLFLDGGIGFATMNALLERLKND